MSERLDNLPQLEGWMNLAERVSEVQSELGNRRLRSSRRATMV